MDIDSDLIAFTATKKVGNVKKLSKEDKEAFDVSKLDEINFFLKHAVSPIPMTKVPDYVELQPLKLVLVIKTTIGKELSPHHGSRLVSASHLSQVRFSVHGNAPTVILSKVRLLFEIILKWLQFFPDDCIIIFCRDTTRAFIQSLKSNCLII